MAEAWKHRELVIGIKQVCRAIQRGAAAEVFIAGDAEESKTRSLRQLCEEREIPFTQTKTMKELGNACAIRVGAAAVAVLKTR